jgi:hypothetical protein
MTVERSADEAILENVFSSSRDRGADTAAPVVEEVAAPVESQDPPPEAATDPKTEAPADDTKPKGYRDPSTGRFVPLGELQTEREKRQEEARLRKAAEENAAQYQRQIQEMQAAMQARQNPPPPPPDPLLDPEGAFAHMQQQLQRQLINHTVNTSERMARRTHGNEVVNEALKAAYEAGIANKFQYTDEPFEDLLRWHKRMKGLQRVGDDVDGFEKQIREQERQKVIEELRTGKVALNGQGQPPPRLPGSLVDATSSGPQGAQSISDEDIARSVFGSGRRRK